MKINSPTATAIFVLKVNRVSFVRSACFRLKNELLFLLLQPTQNLLPKGREEIKSGLETKVFLQFEMTYNTSFILSKLLNF